MIILAECYAIHEKDLMERPELYSRPTRERLMAGAFVRGSDYVEALLMRREMSLQFNAEVLGQYDAVIAPATALHDGSFQDPYTQSLYAASGGNPDRKDI